MKTFETDPQSFLTPRTQVENKDTDSFFVFGQTEQEGPSNITKRIALSIVDPHGFCSSFIVPNRLLHKSIWSAMDVNRTNDCQQNVQNLSLIDALS